MKRKSRLHKFICSTHVFHVILLCCHGEASKLFQIGKPSIETHGKLETVYSNKAVGPSTDCNPETTAKDRQTVARRDKLQDLGKANHTVSWFSNTCAEGSFLPHPPENSTTSTTRKDSCVFQYHNETKRQSVGLRTESTRRTKRFPCKCGGSDACGALLSTTSDP